MENMKFQIGDPVFFYTMIDRVPGVIESSEINEKGNRVYAIRIGETMIAQNVAEDFIMIRKILAAPKYKRGDKVVFVTSKNEQYEGYIEIVDSNGTFEQSEEPSYDIFVQGSPGCLFKHIRESKVIGLAEQ